MRIAFWSAAGLLLVALLINQKMAHSEEERSDKSVNQGRTIQNS